MEFLQLEYFKAVAEMEHMTKAADRLSVTQPTLSAAIQRLEYELGAQLFERRGRGIALNACGKLFLSYVNIIMAQIDKAKSDIRDFVRQQKNTVVVDGTSLFMFDGLVDMILEEYPHAIIKYLPRADTIVESLERQEIDFCITTRDFSAYSVVSDHLTDIPIVLVASAKSELAKKKSVSLSELQNYSFATPRKGSFLWTHINELCLKTGFNPKITYEGKTNQDVFLAVKNSDRIAFALKYYGDNISDPDLVTINIEYVPKQPIYISYSVKQEQNIFVISVIEIIKKYFSEQ